MIKSPLLSRKQFQIKQHRPKLIKSYNLMIHDQVHLDIYTTVFLAVQSLIFFILKMQGIGRRRTVPSHMLKPTPNLEHLNITQTMNI